MTGRLAVLSQVQGLEVLNRLLQAFSQLHLGLPVQQLLCASDVGSPLLWVVAREGQVHDLALGAGKLDNHFGELLDGELIRVSDIYGPDRLLLVHEPDEAIHRVIHVAKRPRLRAVAVDGDILVVEGLQNEVADHSAVVWVHAGSVGVEDSCHTNVDIVHAQVIKRQRLGHSLALVIARPDADGIHMSPVVFRLGCDLRIAIDLAGRRL
mmetsp:Transcript_2974/g.6750  ORF Transcript_2974/g.6750 Transcript_2974/m.6750 type:complete len:209 (+) Transcript_2974:109-735(+)